MAWVSRLIDLIQLVPHGRQDASHNEWGSGLVATEDSRVRVNLAGWPGLEDRFFEGAPPRPL